MAKKPNVFGGYNRPQMGPVEPSPAAPKSRAKGNPNAFGGWNRPQMGPAPPASPKPPKMRVPKGQPAPNVFGSFNRPTNK